MSERGRKEKLYDMKNKLNQSEREREREGVEIKDNSWK